MSPDSSLPDDEMLSSFLDGELAAPDRTLLDARLAGEPALHARLEELRQASRLAAAPVDSLTGTERDRLIRNALAAAAPSVPDLATARARRHQRRQRVFTAAAAAAVVMLAVPLFQAIRSNGDGSDEATTAADFETPADDTAGDESDGFDALDAAETMEDSGNDGESDDSAEMRAEEAEEPATEDFDEGANDSTEAGQAPATTAVGTVFDGFEPDAGFDPLPDDLGPRSDLTAALDAARGAWAGPLGDPVDAAPDDTTDESDTTARERATAFLDGFGGCGELVDVLAGDGFDAPAIAVDYTSTVVDGQPFTIGLLLLADDSGVLIAIDTNTCIVLDREALAAP